MVKKSKTKKRVAARSTKKMVQAPAKKKEVSMLGGILRNLGGLGGRMAGNMIGMGDTGAGIGTGLGASLSKWLGSGDYTVSKNSLVTQFKGSGSIPSMHRLGQSIVVRHKEYITDVYSGAGSPSAFTVAGTYALNPGLATSFPWLSGIAQQFQEYTWRGIVFHYVSTSGQSVASTNTALGSVMIATNYRATAPGYTNKQIMLNEFFSSDAKPSNDFCHPIECNPKENPYNVQYVRGGAIPSGEDQKTYDLGVTSIATQGLPSGAIDCGELWVSYEVELRKPIATTELGSYAQTAHFQNGSGVSTTNPFGTIPGSSKLVDDNIGMTVSSQKISFPLGTVGVFQILFAFPGTTVFSTTNWITGGTMVNMTETLNYYGQGSSTNGLSSSYTANGTGQAMAMGIFTITDNTVVASFSPSFSTLTGASGVDVYISRLAVGST